MEWCKDDVLTLIEMYKERENLWNCTSNEYKNKNKRHDALMETALRFKTTKSEIGRELKNILRTFAGCEGLSTRRSLVSSAVVYGY